MSENAKHTPGPWTYNKKLADTYDKSTPMYGNGGGEICEPVCVIPHDDITEEGYREVIANARLIAAAPDLLEACKEALGAFERDYAIDWDLLAAAIRKATEG